MSQILADLTHPEGPLYQLVMEVKKSNALSVEGNRLAVSNQRQLTQLRVGVALSLCGVLVMMYLGGC